MIWERVRTSLLLLLILLIGFGFRFTGLNWGEGQYIHPDEEFLRQVTVAVQLPASLGEYFDTASSPLNPYNRGYGFFVYGTLPLFVTRAVAAALDRGCEIASAGGGGPLALVAQGLFPYLVEWPMEECWPGSFGGAGVRMVGRSLAALFDLFAILFVFLTGRRLRSREVGLLGALLYGLAVLPIQQSHFYTVDAFSNLFVSATLYLVVRAVQTGRWWNFALAGLTTGLGLACKVSVWPLGLLIGLAGLVRWRMEEKKGNDSLEPLFPLLYVFMAALVAFLAFRVAQPYAFQGPGFFGLHPNGAWLEDMAEIRHQMSGQADLYHGHQWANRLPILFPARNILFWGLGLPLGLVSGIGWGLAAVEMVRAWRRRREGYPFPAPLFLLWVWCTGYFLYQGTQWVKSIRYQLPIYPVLVLFAAWLVVRLLERLRGGRRAWLAWGAGAAAVVGAFCWALALTSVYTRTHTRVEASRWIFEHIPTAVTARLETAGGEEEVHLVIPPGVVSGEGGPLVAQFQVPQEGNLTGMTLNYVIDLSGEAEVDRIHLAVAADGTGEVVLTEGEAVVAAPSFHPGVPLAFSLPPVRLLPDSTYYLRIEAVGGGPVRVDTSVLATEHWDWSPPLRVDGHDPFGGMYRGLSDGGELGLYFDDTLVKRQQLLGWLDEADYIIIASNRLYGSIPRLPTRYPMTIAYYQALFSGDLGFELVADFTSYMALGPFQFPDTEEPFPIPPAPYQYRAAPISIPMPPAEEAFSVYDHPRVLVFAKTPAYSRERAAGILDPSLLENVVWVTARNAGRGKEHQEPRRAVLPPEVWEEQQRGGTWSAMFHRDSLVNRSGAAAALVWYLAVALLGWLAFPLLFAALPRLHDRGYGLARALGILVVAYLTWLAASLHILPNTRGTLVLAVLLLGGMGGAAAWRQWTAIRSFVRERRNMLLAYEALFLFLFVFWVAVRALNPDLWHTYVGGEKPMDMAYLNAVIKSTWFPPYDPWFAGGYINYYYFGFVLVGSLSKLLGIMPTVAYNLALPLFYGLTGMGTFSVAFNLIGGHRRPWRAYSGAVLAVLFLLILGNLGEVRLLVKGFRSVAGGLPFESTIPGLPELVQMLKGMWMVIKGTPLPFRPETPYWDPTRVIPADSSGVGPITEFPAFTFLYGDPHAHMFALPYTLFVIGLAVEWIKSRSVRCLSLLIAGLVIGSLWAGNTWDLPTYLLVGLAGLLLWWVKEQWPALWWALRRPASGDGWQGPGWWVVILAAGSLLWRAALLVVLPALFYSPYISNYIAAYTQAYTWKGPRTPLGLYGVLLGQFLFPLLTLLALDVGRRMRGRWRDRWLWVGGGGVVLVAVVMAVLGVEVALVAVPAAVLALILMLTPGLAPERRLVWFLVSLALSLTLVVEIVVLEGDIGRMNTVFKFYFQVWTMLAVSAAVAVVWLADELGSWPENLRQTWWAVMAVLVAGLALFPLMAVPAKVGDRFTDATGPTLDGMAYMRYSQTWDPNGEVDMGPDYWAIRWMQDNIEGSPVILEGLGSYEYLWGNRVSIYTGLPAVVGWRWHQVQQRMAAGGSEVERRHRDVMDAYNTTDLDRILDILRCYNVRYIYVGPYERLYYTPEGLAKFDEMVEQGLLRVAYDRMGVRRYEVGW